MNRILRHAIVWLSLAPLMGCTPALNWRDTYLGDARDVQALMPCKPDAATRTVQLPTAQTHVDATLRMQGCEASDLQFTLAQMTVPEGVSVVEAQTAWRAASLAALKVTPSDVPVQTWHLQGADAVPPAQRAQVVTATHRAQWVWFVHAQRVYQAAVYGDAKAAQLNEAAEVYFSGIKLP
jgi:hypothetical protein